MIGISLRQINYRVQTGEPGPVRDGNKVLFLVRKWSGTPLPTIRRSSKRRAAVHLVERMKSEKHRQADGEL